MTNLKARKKQDEALEYLWGRHESWMERKRAFKAGLVAAHASPDWIDRMVAERFPSHRVPLKPTDPEALRERAVALIRDAESRMDYMYKFPYQFVCGQDDAIGEACEAQIEEGERLLAARAALLREQRERES